VDVGGPELLIILAVIVLLFGGSQVPKLAKGLGQARREFNAGLRGDPDKDRDKDDPPKPQAKAEVKAEPKAEVEASKDDA
jgi:sec-independent protein translocase protein TatA